MASSNEEMKKLKKERELESVRQAAATLRQRAAELESELEDTLAIVRRLTAACAAADAGARIKLQLKHAGEAIEEDLEPELADVRAELEALERRRLALEADA